MVCFLLMIRRPPRSPHFPYRTLFRSALVGVEHGDVLARAGRLEDVVVEAEAVEPLGAGRPPARVGVHDEGGARAQRLLRSEEHTSELQSRPYLVCRLLLEKKTH